MFDKIMAGKEWIFSGIGVYVLAAIVTLILFVAGVILRKRKSAAQERPKEAKRRLVRYASGVVKIKKGEYFSLPNMGSMPDGQVRIEVKDIYVKGPPKPQVRLHVTSGGSMLICGSKCEKSGINEFLIPAHERGEEEDSAVFKFFTRGRSIHFLRVLVTHINPHGGEIEVNYVELRGA